MGVLSTGAWLVETNTAAVLPTELRVRVALLPLASLRVPPLVLRVPTVMPSLSLSPTTVV